MGARDRPSVSPTPPEPAQPGLALPEGPGEQLRQKSTAPKPSLSAADDQDWSNHEIHKCSRGGRSSVQPQISGEESDIPVSLLTP